MRKNIYLDADTLAALDRLACVYGDHSKVIRAAVQRLNDAHQIEAGDPLDRVAAHLRRALSVIDDEWERRAETDD